MLCDNLKRLKEKRNLTTNQIAELSGIPASTISRIFSGSTDNPSFQTVCDVVIAMNGSLDELTGIKQERKKEVDPLFKLYEKIISDKSKWIYRLFVVCCIMVSVFVFFVIFDTLNPTIGYVRY